ncbi:MAG TPA: DUF6448 family protein [Ktedonobacterales bacterium]|nr:DUF6448 family protein [Ktedonobacterales bacterium]
MPPHCDSMDGPVVKAAVQALDAGNVELVLPYVPREGEDEVVRAFQRALPLHTQSDGVREVADLYFFETVVRVHRAGEGAPYTGLKPAGLDVGPVIPVAERAIESGSPDELAGLLTDTVRAEVTRRLAHAMDLKRHASHGVEAAREYVEAMLGLEVWSHNLYMVAKGPAHIGSHEHEESAEAVHAH